MEALDGSAVLIPEDARSVHGQIERLEDRPEDALEEGRNGVSAGDELGQEAARKVLLEKRREEWRVVQGDWYSCGKTKVLNISRIT